MMIKSSIRPRQIIKWSLLLLTTICLTYWTINKDRNRHQIYSDNPSCGEFYQKFADNLAVLDNYTFNVSKSYMKILSLDNEGIGLLSAQKESNSHPQVVVTAVSANHYGESQGLIKDIHQKLLYLYPEIKLIVYDLGLTKPQLLAMHTYCKCEVRTFEFDQYPDHVNYLKGYTWKPIIIQLMLREYSFIIWNDASVRYNGKQYGLEKVFKNTRKHGLQIMGGGMSSITSRTSENTFKVLKEDPCIFSNYVEVQATWMFFQRNALILNAVMRPWVACALHYGCMDFQNSSSLLNCTNESIVPHSCHRFDQSTIGIILTRLFNKERKYFIFKENDIGIIKRDLPVNYFHN